MLEEAINRLLEVGDALTVPRKAEFGEFITDANGHPVDLSPIAEKALPFPRFKKATVTFSDVPSFVAYWHDHQADGASVIFQDGAGKFTAVLDYHQGVDRTEVPSPDINNGANWCHHRAVLTMKESPEWTIWKASDGKAKTQADFARFIEDNTPDIYDPPAAFMLEVARDLDAATAMQFSSKTRLQNGNVQLKFVESTQATVGTGQATVPEKFVVGFPLFIGEEPVQMEARLRFRIKDGAMVMWYDLWRPHKAIEQAVLSVVKRIADDCSVVPMYGALLP